MSVSETLYHLIVVGATGGVEGRDGQQLLAEASALQKKLKVPDKRFWHIKIKVNESCHIKIKVNESRQIKIKVNKSCHIKIR